MRPVFFVFAACAILAASDRPPYTIDTVAGSDFAGDGGPAIAAALSTVEGLAADQLGNIYVSDSNDHRIRRISSDGAINTVAGNGRPGFRGEGGTADSSQLNSPYGIAVDAAGNLAIADLGNARVRVVSPDGAIRTVAGGGTGKFREGGRAADLMLSAPRNVAYDREGNLYVSDFSGHRVYRIARDGSAVTLAGTGKEGFSGDAGLATLAQLAFPAGIAVDAAGAVYIADSKNKRIRKVQGGKISTVLGAGVPRTGIYHYIWLQGPSGIAIDASGTLYVADISRVVKLTADGKVSAITVPARDVAIDRLGTLYAASGGQVRRVPETGVPETIAGGAVFSSYGDGLPATVARLYRPFAAALDGAGDLLITDQGNRRIRRIAGSEPATTIAAKTSWLSPAGIITANDGALIVSDSLGHRVSRIEPGGTIKTLAGTGKAGFNGFEGIATQIQLNLPEGLALDGAGNLYIADRGNHCIRKVTPGGRIYTYGTGEKGFSGDGGHAALADFNTPRGLAVDETGNLFVADSGNHRIRRISPDGVVDTIAGTGIRGFEGDGGPADLALLDSPLAVAFDRSNGDLFVADTGNHRIRRIDIDGLIETIAGTGTTGFSGDGGLALDAELNFPAGLLVGEAGAVYICDFLNDRVRKLTPEAGPLPPSNIEQPRVVSAASLLPGPIAPGEIVTIFGHGLGPSTPQTGKLSPEGNLEVVIADTQVLFDGHPGALSYVQSGQINVQAPYALAGKTSTEIEVIHAGSIRARFTVPVAPCAPAIFTTENGTGQAAAVNQDGAANGPAKPAARGSVITFYVTGEGQTKPAGIDGKPSTAPFPKPVAPVSVKIGLYDARVEFAGEAPGFSGLLQINARVPAGFAPTGILPLEVTIGGVTSQPGVTIAVE